MNDRYDNPYGKILGPLLCTVWMVCGCSCEGTRDSQVPLMPPVEPVAESMDPTPVDSGVGDSTREGSDTTASGENDNGGTDSAAVGDSEGSDPCPCETPMTFCDGSCVNVAASVMHCGACGTRCFAGQVCEDHQCEGAGVLTPEALQQALTHKDFVLMNVRVPIIGLIPGTDVSISNEDPDGLAAYIGSDRHRRVVVYCRTIPRSLDAIRSLQERGYRSVSYLDGGLVAWENAGYATE